ncbi:MAG: antibiotic biosynthesis monooxygenase [Methylobacter sp.]|uniref:putative quinol monooxygenase n=1 Tax=Methylobacter sp. TaxID=2051955 RepID=UPI002731A4AB|nr:antibiotic biosynthesis monooxygenase [Methylobacter sp.]MDP1664664.1 antibiotic biosynthesis monooxygenase [Methylobacter sp.]
MIELHLVLKVTPGKTRSMIDALQALAKNAGAAPGCMAVEVYKAVGERGSICYDEIWESETVLRNMIVSRHFSQLASLMELSYEPPDCQFRFISKTLGLEFAEQVRGYPRD